MNIKLLDLMFLTLVTAAIGAAQSSYPPGMSPAEQRSMSLKVDELLVRASKSLGMVHEFIKEKRWTAAEAACQNAMDILSPAPYTQGAAREGFAEVYLAEGRYNDAIKIWEPQCKRNVTDRIPSTGLMIAYGKTGQFEKALALMRAYLPFAHIYFIDEAGLPCGKEANEQNIEATALLLLAYPQSPFKGETISTLERANELAPKNGPIEYALAWQYALETDAEQQRKAASGHPDTRPWIVSHKKSIHYFGMAYKDGDPFFRKAVRGMALQNDVDVDASDRAGGG